MFGNDFPDLLVKGYNREVGGQTGTFVEVKTRKGKLSEGQTRFIEEWGEVFDMVVARSVKDVCQHYGWTDEDLSQLDGF